MRAHKGTAQLSQSAGEVSSVCGKDLSKGRV